MQKKLFSYSDILNHASRNNGKVITKEVTFLKCCRAIKFECRKGHKWEVVTHKSLSTWCPECNGSKVQRNTIELMQDIAKERGGKCLSKNYVNSETKLRWECSEGHKWESTPHSVKTKKSWCPKCRSNSMKNTIKDMQVLAAKKGGKCLSKEYVLNNVSLKWQCKEGHTWENQPANITMGQWCSICSKENEKLTIEEMQEIAKSRGGKCISKVYTDIKTKLKWECSKGHKWDAIPSLVKHHGSWCPVCAGNTKKSLEDAKKVAEMFKGELLSVEYNNSKSKLKWKCSEGHTFYKSYSHVVHRRQWCPQCRKKR